MMTKNEEVIFSFFFCKILNPGKENMGKNERGSSFSGLRLRKKKTGSGNERFTLYVIFPYPVLDLNYQQKSSFLCVKYSCPGFSRV